MNIFEIFNFLNPTGANNIIFYPLSAIIIFNSIAFLLYLYNPKNRKILIFLSVPVVVSIICVSANALYQLGNMLDAGKITDSLFLFQMLILLIGMLMLCGITTEFKLKYIFVSHVITEILHVCFYYYCKNYDVGILISGGFHPNFEYLILLVLVYSILSGFLLLEGLNIGLIINNSFVDRFLPKNEFSSHKTIVLLQAYSMIIHSTVMVFINNSTFSDYWAFIGFASFAVLLQLIIIILCLRIMHVYPSSANSPFYVSAYYMIIKTLIGSVYTNYKMFKENTPLNRQSSYFYNKLTYLFVYILVICILNCDVAYAADGSEPSSPVSESNMFNRISQSGASRLAIYAGFYETVSYVREWFQDQIELGALKEELEDAVENCHTAKQQLENIKFKYRDEQVLINKANLILKDDSIKNSFLDTDSVNEYKKKLEDVTIEINAKHQAYIQYKNKATDYMLRRVLGITNCCNGFK